MALLLPNDYLWTQHARRKMMRYRVSESRVKRAIRFPFRTEEGVAPGTLAVMQPLSIRRKNGVPHWSQELWVMCQVVKSKSKNQKSKIQDSTMRSDLSERRRNSDDYDFDAEERQLREIAGGGRSTIVIITVWRFSGQSPKRNPIPEEVLSEIQGLV